MTKYKGTFNWYGEIFELETLATTESQAKSNMCYQIAEKVLQHVRVVQTYFDGSADNFRIEEVV